MTKQLRKETEKLMFQPTKEYCDKCKQQALKSQREDFVKMIDECSDHRGNINAEELKSKLKEQNK